MATLEEAQESLDRVQNFDASVLSRRDELGASFSFDDAVPSAEKAIGIFRKVPNESLKELGSRQLEIIKTQADALYNSFDQVRVFDPHQENAAGVRNQIINEINGSYETVFRQLHPLISYGVARTVDFNRLETEARAALQNIKDQTVTAVDEIENLKAEADSALEEIKRTAAEQGVSQQADYFATEASEQQEAADKWQNSTRIWASALILYGIASFWFHKLDWIKPAGLPETIAFVVSKILIFAILSYMLILSAKNFLSHKHNVVVNKHRQNALQTFNALVEAGRSSGTRDVVLNHAAACIFAPQDSGYIKSGTANKSPAGSAIELIPKTTIRMDGGDGAG